MLNQHRLFIAYFLLIGSSFTTPHDEVPKEDVVQHFKETEQSDIAQAITHYKKKLEKEPNNFDLLFNLAESYYANRTISTAVNYYQKALIVDQNNAQVHSKMGACYYQLEVLDKALHHLNQAIELDPNNTTAYIYLGLIKEQKKLYKEAITYYKKALQIEPNNFDAYHYYGNSLSALNQFEAAIEKFRIARTINPQHIRNLLSLGNTLNILNRTDEALDKYMEILEINPNVCSALYNFGYTLKKQGHLKQAIDIFEKTISLKPDYAPAHFSLALAALALGDFQRGWQEYEWRWKNYNEVPKQFTEPVWDGCDPTGKTILVYAEQGLGDTLQFVRYLKLIKERGGTIIFEAQNPLVHILSLCPYIDKVITKQDPLPTFDFHIALMSLPLIFNTQVETIPDEIPFLYADEQLVNYWKEKLADDTNFKIGICWCGNGRYTRQALKLIVKEKSILLKDFAAIAQLDGVSLYSLQKIDGTEEIKTIDDVFTLHTFGQDFDETNGRFMDTAAVIKNLDLVISIDTAIGHLAGGLGVPTWILLPEPADWRWLHKQTTTPWYPNMRLFKQPQLGDWESVMQKVTDTLSMQLQKPTAIIDQTTKQIQTTRSPKQQLLENQEYLEKYPALEPLVQSLARINQQLHELDDQFASMNFNVFDPKCIELARKACYAHDAKLHLKKKIKKITRS